MPFKVKRTRAFQNFFDNALSRFHASTDDVRKIIDGLVSSPTGGNLYPGISPPVRKLRISLKKYQIGKSKGLRLVYMVIHDKSIILPVYIYKKGNPQNEADIIDNIKKALRAVLVELNANNNSTCTNHT